MKFAGAHIDPDRSPYGEGDHLNPYLIHVVYNDLLQILGAQEEMSHGH